MPNRQGRHRALWRVSILLTLWADLSQMWRFSPESVRNPWYSMRASAPGRGETALMKRSLIVAGVTVSVLATAACGAGDGSVKPAVTKAPTSTSTTSWPTSSQTPTIDPKARPAVTAYMNFVAARGEAMRNPRKLGGADYLPA